MFRYNFSVSSSQLVDVGAYIGIAFSLHGFALIFDIATLSNIGINTITALAISLITTIEKPLRYYGLSSPTECRFLDIAFL